jgi:hypothetical protein
VNVIDSTACQAFPFPKIRLPILRIGARTTPVYPFLISQFTSKRPVFVLTRYKYRALLSGFDRQLQQLQIAMSLHTYLSTADTKELPDVSKITKEEKRNAQMKAVKIATSPEALTKLQQDIKNLVGINKTLQV